MAPNEYFQRVAALLDRLGGAYVAARIIGVTPEYLLACTSGREQLGVWYAARLCDAAGIKLTWLAEPVTHAVSERCRQHRQREDALRLLEDLKAHGVAMKNIGAAIERLFPKDRL